MLLRRMWDVAQHGPLVFRILERLRCSETQSAVVGGASAHSAAGWSDVESLLDHWAELDDDRKMLYAQMAVLVR